MNRNLRSESAANDALAQAAATRANAAWQRPSTCKRPAARPCILRRLFNLFA